jgi:hypothetical protein
LTAISWGDESQAMMDAQRDYWTCFFRMPWKPKDLERLGGEIEEIFTQCWTKEAFSTLTSQAEGGGPHHRRLRFRGQPRPSCDGVLIAASGQAFPGQ